MANYIKRYAYFVRENRQISIYEALRLKDDGKVRNSSVDPDFFDTNQLHFRAGVTPQKKSVDGRSAHFKYFPKQHVKNIFAPKEMTNAHLLYQYMFEKLSVFTIEDRKIPIKVFHNNSIMEYFVKAIDQDGYILIDVMLNVQKTEPSFYKYLWNSQLAIEIKVTHSVDPIKKKILKDNNICTYEASVPKDFKNEIPEDIDILESDSLMKPYIDKLTRSYQNPKFILFGKFISNSVPDIKHKGAYKMLKQFEEDKKKLEEDKNELIEEIKIGKLTHNNIQSQIRELEVQYHKYQIENKTIQDKISSIQQIYKENETLKHQYTNLKKEKAQIESQNKVLVESLEILETQTFWDYIKKLFKK